MKRRLNHVVSGSSFHENRKLVSNKFNDRAARIVSFYRAYYGFGQRIFGEPSFRVNIIRIKIGTGYISGLM